MYDNLNSEDNVDQLIVDEDNTDQLFSEDDEDDLDQIFDEDQINSVPVESGIDVEDINLDDYVFLAFTPRL